MAMANSDAPTAAAEAIASSRSALVREAACLTAAQRKAFGITDLQLVTASKLFDLCIVLLDDNDPRPLDERLDDVEQRFEELEELDVTRGLAEWAESDPELPRWMTRIAAPNFQRYARRFVGAKRYDGLRAAAQQDGSVLFVAARRVLRYLLPLATATDHLLRVISPNQLKQIKGLEELATSSMLELAVSLDVVMNKLLDDGLLPAPPLARADELAALPGTVGELAESLTGQISGESAELIEELSEVLSRKVKGAHDALRFSADPVSQAANSLIELIDRLLRDAFPNDIVLAWLSAWFAADIADYTYTNDGGQTVPTKRGQALCFVYAGGGVGEQTALHDLAATALVAVRNGLQDLKHSDHGTDEEKRAIAESIASVESILLLTCKLAWLGAGEAQLSNIKDRLAAA